MRLDVVKVFLVVYTMIFSMNSLGDWYCNDETPPAPNISVEQIGPIAGTYRFDSGHYAYDGYSFDQDLKLERRGFIEPRKKIYDLAPGTYKVQASHWVWIDDESMGDNCYGEPWYGNEIDVYTPWSTLYFTVPEYTPEMNNDVLCAANHPRCYRSPNPNDDDYEEHGAAQHCEDLNQIREDKIEIENNKIELYEFLNAGLEHDIFDLNILKNETDEDHDSAAYIQDQIQELEDEMAKNNEYIDNAKEEIEWNELLMYDCS